MSIIQKISNKIIRKIDEFVIRNLIVERGSSRRKWIWQTKNFRELTQIYIPRCLFIGFVVIMCWKIHERVKNFRKGELYYESKSKRQEIVEMETKEIEHFLNIPNEFDPYKIKSPVSVEYKVKEKYDYHDLRDDELRKLEEFDEWIKEFKKE